MIAEPSPSREWLAGLAELDPLPEPARPPAAANHWRRLAADSVRAISTERLIELIGAGVNGPAGQSYAAEARRRGLV